MAQGKGGGPKFKYDPSKFGNIIDSVRQTNGSLGQVADLNGIPRQTFYDWLKIGEVNRNNGDIETDLAKLSCKIRFQQAHVVIDLFRKADEDPKKAHFIMWWLGKICREDFGDQCKTIEEMKQIIIDLINAKGD